MFINYIQDRYSKLLKIYTTLDITLLHSKYTESKESKKSKKEVSKHLSCKNIIEEIWVSTENLMDFPMRIILFPITIIFTWCIFIIFTPLYITSFIHYSLTTKERNKIYVKRFFLDMCFIFVPLILGIVLSFMLVKLNIIS